MILDVPNSAVALAVAEIVREKNRVMIGSGAGTDALTGKACTPTFIHWTYDTWEAGHALGRAVVEQGGKKWFFLTADYAFGHVLESSMAEAVRAAGGEVLGQVRHPLGTADFSQYLRAGAVERGGCARPRQCRRRQHQHAQAGARSSGCRARCAWPGRS